MKYFEYNEPHYALIKAESREESYRLYEKHVADLEDEPVLSELSRLEAFMKYTETLLKMNKDVRLNDVAQRFRDEEILLIDGGLI